MKFHWADFKIEFSAFRNLFSILFFKSNRKKNLGIEFLKRIIFQFADVVSSYLVRDKKKQKGV